MSEKIEQCLNFKESPLWRQNPDRKIGITWDGWCSLCGFRLENKSFGSGLTIEGNGRKLGLVNHVIEVNGIKYKSERDMVACSKCCPALIK